MKTLLLLLLCLSSIFPASAQEIELQGTYGASFVGGESITFVGRDSFYFGGFYCTFGVHGRGTCALVENRLYLYFEKATDTSAPPAKASAPQLERRPAEGATALLTVHVTNQKGDPLPYVSIFARQQNADAGAAGYRKQMGTSTDSLGKAALTIPRAYFPIVLRTSAIGYETVQLPMDSFAHYRVDLAFHEDKDFDRALNAGQVKCYEIGELNEDLILMRPCGSGEPYRKYRKKKETAGTPYLRT